MPLSAWYVVLDGKEISALRMIKAVPLAQHHLKTETPLRQETGERLTEATHSHARGLRCHFGKLGALHFNPMERHMQNRLHNPARHHAVRKNEVHQLNRLDPVLDVDALLHPQHLHPPSR
ncbi:hypothetical protein MnTg02_02715 [bacterium MnTg02]|nr:hypothetical protein MnTg02_02715 [bacterium MnTg02]